MVVTLVSFRGPAEAFTKIPREARVYGWMDGWDGWDEKKRPLIFFHLDVYETLCSFIPKYTVKTIWRCFLWV